MDASRTSIDELIAYAAGEDGLTLKYQPVQGARTPHAAGALCFRGRERCYFVFTEMLKMSRYVPHLDYYSDDVFETVVAWGPAGHYDSLPATGNFQLHYDTGPRIWVPGFFEELRNEGQPVRLGIPHAALWTSAFDGRSIQFLLEMHLTSSSGNWLIQHGIPPEYFRLKRASPDELGQSFQRHGVPS